MKTVISLILFLPLFCRAQEVPPSGFDKVRIADGNTIIQAELLPLTSRVDAKPDRLYYWYGSNLIHATQGGFSGTLLNGSYSEYYANKSLKEQGVFKNGLKEGIWKSWNTDGFLVKEFTWKKGLRSGHFFTCDEKGVITGSGEYRHDQLVAADTTSFWRKVNIFKKKD
jgi:antitoxin component YwqK of YwqJK toxin-antitoxin module